MKNNIFSNATPGTVREMSSRQTQKTTVPICNYSGIIRITHIRVLSNRD